jgi:hypothetical protein
MANVITVCWLLIATDPFRGDMVRSIWQVSDGVNLRSICPFIGYVGFRVVFLFVTIFDIPSWFVYRLLLALRFAFFLAAKVQ